MDKPIVDESGIKAQIAIWKYAREDFAKLFSEKCDLDCDSLNNEVLNACILQCEVIGSSLLNMLSLVRLAAIHSKRS